MYILTILQQLCTYIHKNLRNRVSTRFNYAFKKIKKNNGNIKNKNNVERNKKGNIDRGFRFSITLVIFNFEFDFYKSIQI